VKGPGRGELRCEMQLWYTINAKRKKVCCRVYDCVIDFFARDFVFTMGSDPIVFTNGTTTFRDAQGRLKGTKK